MASWPTYRDLTRELMDAGCEPQARKSTAHWKFKAPDGATIVVPYQHPGWDATRTVVRSVRRFIEEHGRKL